MLIDALFLFVGLMLGWFFLSTPAWATALYAKIISYVPFLSGTKSE